MTSAPTAETTPGPPSAVSTRWTMATFGVVALPLVVRLVAVLVDRAPNPGGDLALIEMRVSDVGGGDTPVLGSYSRFGANHPGPLWFYLLALPYRFLGSDHAALQAGTLLYGIGALALILFAARRVRHPAAFAATAFIVAVLLAALGPAWVADPWEPRGLTLLVAALALVTFAAVDGSTRALPVAAVLASVIGQAYATLLPYAVAMGAVAVAACTHRALQPGAAASSRRATWRAVAVAGVLALVLWSPPLVEQVRGRPGNLTSFLETMRDAPEPVLGLSGAWRAVSLELSAGATWLGNEVPLLPFQTIVDVSGAPLVPAGAVLLVAAIALAAWRRDRIALGLGLVAVVALLAGVISLSRLVGPLFVWIPYWTKVLGLLTALAVAWSGLRATPERLRPRVDRLGTVVLGLGVVALTLSSAVAALRDEPPTRLNEAIRELAVGAAPEVGEVALVRSDAHADLAFEKTGIGLATLVLELERSGVDVVVDRDLANRYGDERARPGRASMEVRMVNATDAVPDGFRTLVEIDPLTAAERSERTAVLAALREHGDPDDLVELARMAGDEDAGPLVERLEELPGDLPVLRLIGRPLPSAAD